MATENLKQQLLELHAALASGDSPDPEMVALLRMLDVDIRAALAQSRPASDEPSPALPQATLPSPSQSTGEIATPLPVPDESGLTSRAQAISARFAAQHPHLEPVLRELTDTLQRIGI